MMGVGMWHNRSAATEPDAAAPCRGPFSKRPVCEHFIARYFALLSKGRM